MKPNWQEMVKDARSKFPEEFGLRAFPGERFKISESASYVSDYPAPDTIYLYTMVKRGERWEQFCKGTPDELRREIVKLPE